METLGSVYGECACGAEFEPVLVQVRLGGHDHVEVLDDVPKGLCPNCQSRVYKAPVLEAVEAAIAAFGRRAPG